MKKWFKDWTPLPADMILQTLPVVVAVLAVMLIPLLQHISRASAWSAFGVALAAAAVGTVLLFIARLPLYRRGQFFTFGLRLLDTPHRRLYRAAYVFIGASAFLLLILLAALR